MEQEKNYSLTVRVSSKGEIYGDYTAKANSEQELEERLAFLSQKLAQLRAGYNG